MICSQCKKEKDKLLKCPYCQRAVCSDCLVDSEVGRVCRKCDEEVARQINYDEFELKESIKEESE